jgi:hypothetical protein
MNFLEQVSWVSLGASPYEFLGFCGFLGASFVGFSRSKSL